MSGKSRKHCKNDNTVCVYERENLVYLLLKGSGPPPSEDPVLKSLKINQSYVVTAEDDELIIRADREGAVEHRFNAAVVILAPEVRLCPRNNSCKQVTRFQEVSAFIDVGPDDTRQLQACDVIVASEDEVIYVPSFECDCDESDVAQVVANANFDDHEEYPRAESFLIHLRKTPDNGGNNDDE